MLATPDSPFAASGLAAVSGVASAVTDATAVTVSETGLELHGKPIHVMPHQRRNPEEANLL
jgi:uncharacterized protein YpuA (DUF1002 family)